MLLRGLLLLTLVGIFTVPGSRGWIMGDFFSEYRDIMSNCRRDGGYCINPYRMAAGEQENEGGAAPAGGAGGGGARGGRGRGRGGQQARRPAWISGGRSMRTVSLGTTTLGVTDRAESVVHLLVTAMVHWPSISEVIVE
uniref:Serine, glycine, tyrosine and glutamine-rich protein-like n=1 Tax=Crassostrea virginica TaxID=6565 RepID=A0A8B8F1F3_CRAVI|nr:serine, glycine, tyrosine and glutamine-rich protein-like [Crassostrea virginica]